MSEGLKPCPRCGSKRILIDEWLRGKFVMCWECKAITPLTAITLVKAIELWNSGNVLTEAEFNASQECHPVEIHGLVKPCPFCGTIPTINILERGEALPPHYTDTPFYCKIECPECDYVGAEGVGMTEREAFKDALDKWNRRVSDGN